VLHIDGDGILSRTERPLPALAGEAPVSVRLTSICNLTSQRRGATSAVAARAGISTSMRPSPRLHRAMVRRRAVGEPPMAPLANAVGDGPLPLNETVVAYRRASERGAPTVLLRP
jgi:hypothetical protein